MIHLSQKCFLMLLAFLAFQGAVNAQTITGKVSSATGPLPGVNVLVKGTSTGTATGADGDYTIQASTGSTLVFSFIGYVPQEVTVGNTSVVNVTLQEDLQALEEVVVTALGIEQEKRSLG